MSLQGGFVLIRNILLSLLVLCAVTSAASAAEPTFSDRKANLAEFHAIRIGYGAGTVRIVIDLTRQVEFKESYAENPSRMIVDLQNTWLNPTVKREIELTSTVGKRIRIAQFNPTTVRVVIESMSATKLFYLPGGNSGQRLIIDLGNTNFKADPNFNKPDVDAQRERDLETQREIEREAQRERELEAQRERELESQRDRELQAQQERERQLQREQDERERELERRERELEKREQAQLELERRKKVQQEQERLERERLERERELEKREKELEKREQEQREKELKAQRDKEIREQREREKEIMEREKREKKERERLEKEQREREKKERKERERLEKERGKRDGKDTVAQPKPDESKVDEPTDELDRDLNTLTALKGRKIVIDPGHGGNDAGAIGPTGVMEKNVTLKVATELKRLLEAEGAQVILTRYDDSTVSPKGAAASDIEELGARCDVANRNNADIFISIHADAFTRPEARGTTGYYYSKGSGRGQQLADAIRRNLVEQLGTPSRGTQPCNFYVVKNTDMPATLIELGFISNKEEEKLLDSVDGVKRAAQGILDGIEDYFG